MRVHFALKLAAPLALTAATLAACGSSGSGSGGSSAASNVPSSPTAPAHAAAVQVVTRSGPDGTYLTDKSGRTLYLYTPDGKNKSNCNAGCDGPWPPLTTTAAPTAGGSARSSALGTTKRADGSTQVTYAGHPLYYFSGDSKPGELNGEGSGNIWFVVSPAGAKLTGAAATTSESSSSSSSNGSGGY